MKLWQKYTYIVINYYKTIYTLLYAEDLILKRERLTNEYAFTRGIGFLRQN